jgi:hypothetical protein
MYQVGPNDELQLLSTELPAFPLVSLDTSYDPLNPFLVDHLSIMAYADGFTTPQAPSLVGDITFYRVSVLVPEPSTLALAVLACGALMLRLARDRRFARRGR